MAKKKTTKKAKEVVLPIVVSPFTSDEFSDLKPFTHMAETLAYHHLMFSGVKYIEKVQAVIVETKDMDGYGIPENEAYVKLIKSADKKYAIEFYIECSLQDTEGDIDDL